MPKDSLNVDAMIDDVERQLRANADLPPALVATIQMLLVVVKLLAGRVGLSSRNSSLPPASDPNREKKARSASAKARGGQAGHLGANLTPVSDPDEIQTIEIDRRSLPPGQYTECGYESRQLFDIRIARFVTEYRAQMLQNERGQRFVAQFPEGLTQKTQYGASIKANAVYLSMYQLIPYERTQTHFDELFDIPLSAGTLYNFNQDAFERLALFEAIAKSQLRDADQLHADETGINIDGQRMWLHCASNPQWTWLAPHPKRGKEAMDAIGILPHFQGLLVHDHWKPYYRFTACSHALCNAHHQRELTWAHEQEGQQWAKAMSELLTAINQAVIQAGGSLPKRACRQWQRRYRQLLSLAENECPPPKPAAEKGNQRGRVARSKSRNLLERLRDYEDDVLRFMENPNAPYTNNQGERDIRMLKVQQKISGCFRSMKGAEIFCRIRSYLSTCQKQNVGIGEALELLFAGQWPPFIQKIIDAGFASAE